MARQRGIDQKIQVTRGFVTEFTPVAFPQEAAIDVDNCIIDSDGSVRRRGGIDLEQKFRLNSIAGGIINESEIPTIGLSNHLWEFVGNSGTLNIVVFQVGTRLQMFAQFGAVSANLLGEVDLTPFAVNAAKLQTTKVQVASGLGDLYVVNEHMDPVRITYDGTTFTPAKINLRIRDFEGLDDVLVVDERPQALLRSHYYNLLNQGWTDANIKSFAGVDSGVDLCAESGSEGGVIGTRTFPSNADIMTVGIVTNASGDLEFDHNFIRNTFLGNTPAPKGHFILDAFNQDFDTVSGCVGIGSRVFVNRPEATTFHQGRVFYSTPNVQNKVGGIFYSQQLIAPDRDGNAFQEADPTAEDINDLVDTDGGFLPMPGVGEIFTLREIGNGIAVIASNGVWFVTGADGSGLTATNIKLSKAGSTGALSASSVVEAEGSIMYFGIDGIMQITVNELGELDVANITQKSIQTFYINISAASRRDAAGIYIPEQRKVFWGYRQAQAATTPTTVSFDRFLVLDFEIQGFYKYSIGEDATQKLPEIVGMSLVKPLTEGTATTPVTDLTGAVVLAEDLTVVTIEADTEDGQVTQLKMACLAFSTVDNGFKTSFATFHSRSFLDWQDTSTDGTGIAMTSFIEFAEFNMGALHTKGKPTHVHSFFQKTSKNLEPGGYYELPPLFYVSTGLRVSQSVLEVLNRPSANMRVSQSVMEVLLTTPSDFRVSQSVTEVLSEVSAPLAAAGNDADVAIAEYLQAITLMNTPPESVVTISVSQLGLDTREALRLGARPKYEELEEARFLYESVWVQNDIQFNNSISAGLLTNSQLIREGASVTQSGLNAAATDGRNDFVAYQTAIDAMNISGTQVTVTGLSSGTWETQAATDAPGLFAAFDAKRTEYNVLFASLPAP